MVSPQTASCYRRTTFVSTVHSSLNGLVGRGYFVRRVEDRRLAAIERRLAVWEERIEVSRLAFLFSRLLFSFLCFFSSHYIKPGFTCFPQPLLSIPPDNFAPVL